MRTFAVSALLHQHKILKDRTDHVTKPVLGWRRCSSKEEAAGDFMLRYLEEFGPDWNIGNVLVLEIPEEDQDAV